MLNRAHETWLACAQGNDSLLTAIDSCAASYILFDSATQALRNEIASLYFLSSHQVAVIDTLQGVIKDQKRYIQQLRVHRGLMGVLDGVLVAVIGYLLITHG